MTYDRTAETVGNITHLEHVNLLQPDQQLATQFYISGLGLTRDPYMMTGVDNMWVNAGETQFHLPTGKPQHFRGAIVLVLPNRRALLERLGRQAGPLRATSFAFTEQADCVEVRCPWGNRMRCHEPDPARFGALKLGIAQLEVVVPPGTAEGIARFYREIFGANASIVAGTGGRPTARVQVGAWQHLMFTESAEASAPYDGHHIQIYIADFSGPYRRLLERGLVAEESSEYQYRFVDIVDVDTAQPLFSLEHEVRSMTHPLFRRPMLSRNPEQNNRNYRRGRDAFVPE